MTIFVFNQPKKTTLSILHIFSILMLLISVLAIITVVLWREYPQHITVIDKYIPDFYGDKINRTYKNAEESPTDILKYKYYYDLYTSLKGITVLNKYYNYKQKSIKFLIAYHIRSNQLQQAINLSEKWQKDYPYDFLAKFQYAEVLALGDMKKAKEYLGQLHEKYPSIDNISNTFYYFLLKNGFINEAIILENERTIKKRDNATFKVYFIDGPSSVFAAKQSAIADSESIGSQAEAEYSIVFNHKFNLLKGIRFDLDGLAIGQKFKLSRFALNTKEEKYKDVQIKGLNHIKKYSSNNYEITGEDPHIVFSLPAQLEKYSGNVNLLASIVVENESAKALLAENKEWQFFYSQSGSFTEEKSKKLSFSFLNNEVMATKLEIENAVLIQRIRVNFPSMKGLRVKNINILLNGVEKVRAADIKNMHSIKYDKSFYIINGEEPYIVFDTNMKESLKKVSIRIEI